MSILVTGGAGFIGSHTCVELLNAGYEVVVVDNLYNASEKALERVEQITGKKVTFYEADILDRDALNAIFDKEQVESVIHFAGYKAVGESVRKPIEYYYNNITGTLILCDVMRKHNVKNIVFSSSATVYGDPAFIPITEECPKGKITNPYGQTKGMLEQVLTDIYVSDLDRSIKFYNEALDLHEVRRKTANDFIIVYLSNEVSDFELELTWLKEHPQPYNLGECEFHLAFRADDYEEAHKKHKEMGCICFENEEMGIYFIEDPDGYWLEILP